MSPAGRRTSAFYLHQRKQQRIRQVQTLTFTAFCLAVIALGIYSSAHKSSTSSVVAHSAGNTTVAGTHGGGSIAADVTTDRQLSGIVQAWSHKYSFASTVSVVELNGQHRTAALNPVNQIVTASTFKVYVAYGVLHAIEQGQYTLQSVTSDGNTIATDLNNMIVNSDNDASRTLGFMIGWPALDRLLASQGMTHTNTNNYIGSSTVPVGDKYSTAADFTMFFTKLNAGQLLNSAHTQQLLGLLKQQNYRSGIPAGVPNGVAVADKPGWLSPADGDNEYVQNDVGVVYGPKSTYVLIVTTTGKSMAPLADLSKQVYAYLQQ